MCAGQNGQCNDWKKTSYDWSKFFAADHSYSEFFIFWSFPCFIVSAFTVLLIYKNMYILSQNTQSIHGFLIRDGSQPFHDGGRYHIENQPIDLLCKSIDWFLYDIGLRHERVNNGGSWNVSSNLITGWVLINKGSENPFINKSSICIHLKVVYENCKLLDLTKFTSITTFWFIQVIQLPPHSTSSTSWWLVHQSNLYISQNWNKLG